jgi:hypothetical protein
MSKRNRPELLIGRVLMMTGFLVEWLFWGFAVTRRAPFLFGAIGSFFSFPASLLIDTPPILLWCLFFGATTFLYPGRFLLLVAERRMDFWIGYGYELAMYEKYKLKDLRQSWWFSR